MPRIHPFVSVPVDRRFHIRSDIVARDRPPLAAGRQFDAPDVNDHVAMLLPLQPVEPVLAPQAGCKSGAVRDAVRDAVHAAVQAAVVADTALGHKRALDKCGHCVAVDGMRIPLAHHNDLNDGC